MVAAGRVDVKGKGGAGAGGPGLGGVRRAGAARWAGGYVMLWCGAGDGDRTHVASLEGWGFTTKLRPLVGGYDFSTGGGWRQLSFAARNLTAGKDRLGGGAG